MDLFRKARRVFCYQFSRIVTSFRIPLIFVLIGIYIYSTVEPIADFSKAVNIAATPWVFPHLTNDFICQMVFMAGAVILFCDAPFTDESYLYIVSRSGRTAWAGGHVLYILILSLLYVIYIAMVSVVPLIGHLQWSTEWGKILGTLAKTDAASQYALTFTVNGYLTVAFEPVKAMVLSFVLEWACSAWLGLLLYFFNTVTHKMIGTFLSVAFVLLDVMISNEWTPAAYVFSPLTLAQLSSLSGMNQRYGITLAYAAGFFIISLCMLVILCICSGHFEKWYQRMKGKLEKDGSKFGKEIS